MTSDRLPAPMGDPPAGRPLTGRPLTGRPLTGRPLTGRPLTGRPLGALGRRLLAMFLLVALIGVVLVAAAGLIGSNLGLAVNETKARQAVADQVAAALAAGYAATGKWSTADLSGVETLAAGLGVAVTVRDSSGEVVLATGSGRMGMGMGAGMTGSAQDSSAPGNSAQGGRISRTVLVEGVPVGSLILRFGSPVDSGGRQVAWTWILAAALVTFAAASIAGWFTVRSLTAPLVALTASTRAFAAGAADPRPAVRGIGELGELADAFDEATAAVQHSERVRRQMAADVAHELRTPLAALQAGLEELRDGMAEPDPATLARLHDQSLRLARTVDELAQLSAADAAVLDLARVEVDVSSLVGDEIRVALPQLRAAGLSLDQTLTPGLTLTADPLRLRQVIGNLLANCARHCRSGDRVTVTVDEVGAQCRIVVSDTGPGIAAADLPHVLTRFWRGADRTSVPGAGIGLAVAAQLVEAHHGRLSIESPDAGGTTVTVELPRPGA